MSEQKSGFWVRHASCRTLQKDHAAFYSRGGVVVPWTGEPPRESSAVIVRIETPDGTIFDIPATTGRHNSGRTLNVTFERLESNRAFAALDTYLRGDLFKRAVAAESAATTTAPVIEPFGALALAAGGAGTATDATAATIPADDTDAEPPSEAHSVSPAGRGADEALHAAGDHERADLAGEEGESGDPYGGDGAGEEREDGEDGEDGEKRQDGEKREDGEEREDGEDEALQLLPAGLAMPGPGDQYAVFIVRYASLVDFVAIAETYRREQRLRFPFADTSVKPGTVAQVRITLPGHNVYKTFGVVEFVRDGQLTMLFDPNNEQYRQAYLYLESASGKNRLKNEKDQPPKPPAVNKITETIPVEDVSRLPIRRRLQRMGMDDKINLALSGDREERMALAMDGNKAIHHYLLRNAKISLDEIAFMSRLPSMNPDVLDKIAENPQYTQNPTVVKGLVYNPKTPVLTAIRLLDRLPRQEVVNLSKRANLNSRLVMAAKKKVESRGW